jgi:hypothetical protein
MAHFQVSMDWQCRECRRSGTRWFEYEAGTVEVPNSSSIKIDYGNQLELAETEHSMESRCNGQLEQGGGTYRQVSKSAFSDPLWLEVKGK